MRRGNEREGGAPNQNCPTAASAAWRNGVSVCIAFRYSRRSSDWNTETRARKATHSTTATAVTDDNHFGPVRCFNVPSAYANAPAIRYVACMIEHGDRMQLKLAVAIGSLPCDESVAFAWRQIDSPTTPPLPLTPSRLRQYSVTVWGPRSVSMTMWAVKVGSRRYPLNICRPTFPLATTT